MTHYTLKISFGIPTTEQFRENNKSMLIRG